MSSITNLSKGIRIEKSYRINLHEHIFKLRNKMKKEVIIQNIF